jgi:hypothetical protein
MISVNECDNFANAFNRSLTPGSALSTSQLLLNIAAVAAMLGPKYDVAYSYGPVNRNVDPTTPP